MFEQELRAWGQSGFIEDDLKKRDWRVVARREGCISLRRAFNIRTRADFLRYALPVLVFCIFLFALKSWAVAGMYLAILLVKWFVVVTDIHADTPPRYQVRILGYSLFGDTL